MTQYSGALAVDYNSDRIHTHPLNRLTYETWLKEVGDVRGLRVLDLACGGGHTSRLLTERGAFVTGVDISPEMIEHAKRVGGVKDRTIEYLVGDAATLDLGRRFDLVTPSFLFHYAESEDEMRKYVRTIRTHLISGGRLVALNAHDSFVPRRMNANHWSEWIDPSDTDREGAGVRLHILDNDGEEVCAPEYRHWRAATYERVLANGGFIRIRFSYHRIPDELRAQYQNWEELEARNASCVLSAINV